MRHRLSHAAALVAFVALASYRTDTKAEAGAVDAETRAKVVQEAATLIEQKYFDKEVAARTSKELLAKLEQGRYEPYDKALSLAAALTEDLSPVDRHFRVSWRDSGASTETAGSVEDPWEKRSRRRNFGFEQLRRLPGNIGYLDLRFFDAPDQARETAAAAMSFLARADAIIIDLRQNGGGEPEMVQLLCSHFFGPEPVHLNSLYWREGDVTNEFWTLTELDGPRMPELPLFVLIGARTGSGAEEFAYNMQTRKRATLIGETTYGAANPGDQFPLGHGFSLFVSTGTAINPVTGKNWEEIGVRPDVEVPAAGALPFAQRLALQAVQKTADSPTWKRELDWALVELTAGTEPVRLERSTVRQYPGQYGTRQIRQEGNGLSYQRGRRQKRMMIPVDQDLFVLDGISGTRIAFEREDGRIVRLLEMWDDGGKRAIPRD